MRIYKCKINFNAYAESILYFSTKIELELLFSYHPAWIFVAFLIAAIYTFVLYKKDELLEDVSKTIKLILAGFRFVTVFIIAILLLGIILENFILKKEKPLIFIAHDTSESIIQTKDSTFYKEDYVDNLKALKEDLSKNYDVVDYSFADGIENGIKDKYVGKKTNISQVFDQIYSQYSNRNIGAIILSTDGIYNAGANPIYAINRKTYVPVFTIGLGDTNQVKDVKIDEVFNNDIAFLGNEFPVEVSVSQKDFQGQKVYVKLLLGDKIVSSQTVQFKNKKEQKKINFILKATRIGFIKYTVKIQELDDEFTYKNNTANFYIDVIDGRQKIALLHSGIHPDLGAISYVIENNKNYEVDVKIYSEMENIGDYDLLICHNYNNQNQSLNQAIKDGKKPVLFIVGNNSNLADLNNLNIGFSGNDTKTEDVQFAINGNFSTILFPPSISNLLNNAPPLKAPFGSFKFSKSLDVFAYQKIGNIILNQPLIYFSEKNASKYGVIMGEGIWRWRLYDQAKNQSTANFELFISKMISYLAVKKNKNPFKVNVNSEYEESEDVIVLAELYNSAYDLVNTAEVDFTLTNSDEKDFDYHFFKTSNAYKLELGKLPQGIYIWNASTTFSGKNYKASGTFLVKEVKKEWLNSTANHRLLKNIADNTNGKFYLPKQLNQLKTDIEKRDDIVTVAYNEKSFKDLIDYKWLFYLIIVLMSAEWFIRKFNGGY